MKAYIKPVTTETKIELQHLMQNSITTVTGVDGLGKGEGDFTGGAVDSRSGNAWDDED